MAAKVTIKDWSPDKITAEIEKKAMDRLEKAARVVANSARSLAPVGVMRPQYKTGKAWTERVPGTLRDSIRVTRLTGDPKNDVRVYAGGRQSDKLTAYYARFVEYGTCYMARRSFLRPALDQNKGAIMQIMENG